jgi:hypothetical protein
VSAPFRVWKSGDGWFLQQNRLRIDPNTGAIGRRIWAGFETPGDAIDHAYRNWPWWP